jgi:hypothetical protein
VERKLGLMQVGFAILWLPVASFLAFQLVAHVVRILAG